MAFDLKSEIYAQINKTNDETLRTVLLLLLGVLEASIEGTASIKKAIEDLRTDEAGLRDAVLNGHADVHHDHHEWIAKRMAEDCAAVCTWSRGKMDAEKQDAKDAAELARAGKKAAVEQAARTIIIAFTALVAGVLGAVQFLK